MSGAADKDKRRNDRDGFDYLGQKLKKPKPPKGRIKLLRCTKLSPDRKLTLPPVFEKLMPDAACGTALIGVFLDQNGGQLIVKPVGRHTEEEIL